MKRYIKSSGDYDYYCVVRIDRLYNDKGYFSKDGMWLNRPYTRYIKKFSKSGAYAKAKKLNAENTDDDLTYTAEKITDTVS